MNRIVAGSAFLCVAVSEVVGGSCDNCDCSWAHGGSSCGSFDGSHCWACCCGGPCDCSWTHGGSSCGSDDGTVCWAYCCKGNPPSPSPSPTPSPTPSPSSPTFCPSDGDFITDYGSPHISGNGWTITGGARVSSKASFNVLGGYIEFDMDVSGTHVGVNANFYTTSPKEENCGKACYCDAQGAGGGCMELDLIECNGNCAWATTWHTQIAGGQSCDAGGCQHVGGSTNQYHVKADFTEDGWMTVNVNGQALDANSMNPKPAGQDASALANMMRSRGAVLESSQWTGWVPGSCGTADLGSSRFSISNIRVQGSIVKGPTPRQCSLEELQRNWTQSMMQV